MNQQSSVESVPSGGGNFWTVETGLYIAIGAAALFLRLLHLGSAPLTDVEAREALAVWRFVTANGDPIQPVSAAWFTLASFAFTLFGANEFWARFWPAIAGTALVFVPLMFRRWLGRGTTLIACVLLAISPVMLASSRTTDGTTLAAVSVWLMTYGVWRIAHNENVGALWAGVGLGIGLADGPRFVSAVATALFAFVVIALALPEIVGEIWKSRVRWQSKFGRMSLSAAITFVLFSSAGLINRTGLGAAGMAIPRWINGWLPSTAARGAAVVPEILFVYEPLILLLGLGGVYAAFVSDYWRRLVSRFQNGDEFEEEIDARRLDIKRILGAAAVGSLLYSVIYPAREASDALWVVLPLAILAAMTLADVFRGGFEWRGEGWETIVAQAGVLSVMLLFVYFNLAAFAKQFAFVSAATPYPVTLMLAGGVIALGVLVTVLFAAGWSKRAAMQGAVIALGAVMLVGTLGAGWGVTQLRANDPRELWTPTATSSNVHLLTRTLYDISGRAVGADRDIEIVVLNDPARNDAEGLLGWELRDFRNAQFVDALSPAINAPVVITSEAAADPTLGSAYIGQKFAVVVRQGESAPSPENIVNWWLFRAGPMAYEHKVVWVRQDVLLMSGE